MTVHPVLASGFPLRLLRLFRHLRPLYSVFSVLSVPSLRSGQALSVLSVFSVFSVHPSTAVSQECSVPPLLPAYAHNDYRNRHPLQDALALGYQGVEADYVLVNGELLVAHGRGDALRGRTLERLYLAPLRARVRRCGWVQSSDRPFLLTIEYKDRELQGHRALHDLLTRYADIVGSGKTPGPVQVILVGWHPPLREIAAESLQLATVQVRVSRSGLSVPEGDSALVGLVSLDYGNSLRWRGRGPLSREDRRTLARIREVRKAFPGRLVRAYNVPSVPRVYQLLLSSGVDLIGAKDLRETAGILGRSEMSERSETSDR
jgi:hypothetical protein